MINVLWKRLLWTAAGAAVFLLSSVASADTVSFASFGFTYSRGWGDVSANGFGAEASVSIYPMENAVNFGFFVQGQGYGAEALPTTPPDASSLFGRGAAGLQLAWGGIGVEAGWAYASPANGLPGSHGVQIAHFLSAGILVIAPRFTIPIGSERATEFAVTVGLKLPIVLTGDAESKFPVNMFIGKAPAGPQGNVMIASR